MSPRSSSPVSDRITGHTRRGIRIRSRIDELGHGEPGSFQTMLTPAAEVTRTPRAKDKPLRTAPQSQQSQLLPFLPAGARVQLERRLFMGKQRTKDPRDPRARVRETIQWFGTIYLG